MPPRPGCPGRGPSSPEVTRAICRVPSTSFSQAPWYALPVHLCRFRVRSIRWGCFLEVLGRTRNPISGYNFRPSSTPSRPRNINLVPIDYGSRPRLRGRLTLRGLTLRRNPWTFGDRVSHSVCRYSCQHSHFRYLQHPSRGRLRRPTERSATTQRTDDRYQRSVTRYRIVLLPIPRSPSTNPTLQTLDHLGNGMIFVTPARPGLRVDIAKLETIADPHPHLIRRAHGNPQETAKLELRVRRLAKAFGNIGRYRFRRAANSIAERPLLDPRQSQTDPMDLQRQPSTPPERPQGPQRTSPPSPLSSVIRYLSSVL